MATREQGMRDVIDVTCRVHRIDCDECVAMALAHQAALLPENAALSFIAGKLVKMRDFGRRNVMAQLRA